MHVNIREITAPEVEPVTAAEVKLYTHISYNQEDSIISSWIKTGRELAQAYQHAAYITQTVEVTLDRFPANGFIYLPRPPLQSVASIKYYDVDDTEYTFSSDYYQVDTTGRPGRIALAYGATWPAVTLRDIDAVRIRFDAGFGDDPGDVPQHVRDAIMLYCAYRNENRAGETDTPKAFYNLLRHNQYPVD